MDKVLQILKLTRLLIFQIYELEIYLSLMCDAQKSRQKSLQIWK